MTFARGDIVTYEGDPEEESYLWTESYGIVEYSLGDWGYMVRWPFEGYTTSEKGRHLRKQGHSRLNEGDSETVPG